MCYLPACPSQLKLLRDNLSIYYILLLQDWHCGPFV